MDRGVQKAKGTRAEWTLKLETLVIIWLVLGLCRYARAINWTESILSKMTKVVRVNLMQDSLVGRLISTLWLHIIALHGETCEERLAP